MNENNAVSETIVDPVCGKTLAPGKGQISSADEQGTHYFCSQACRQKFESADTKTKKGWWAKFTERLKNAHCTQTPPECR